MRVLFSYAFRPLFLACVFFAMVAIPLWVFAWVGFIPLPIIFSSNPIWWHAHEMLFGFAGAAVGGFLLTAVAAWTKRPPVAGGPLLALTLLWLNARLLLFLPPGAGSGWVTPAAAAMDLGYDVLLLALMTREVVAARNRRNYKVLGLLGLFALANAAFYAGVRGRFVWVEPALLAGLWVLVFLLTVIGGRVIPAFTGNWLRRQGAEGAGPPPFDRLDLAATVALVLFASLTLLPVRPNIVALTGLVTALLLLARLSRWQGLRARKEPFVFILHVGFSWLPVGVLLFAGSALGWWPPSVGVHALSVGAIATMVVAIAGRAALGHTGRPLRGHPALTAAYVFITIAAISRVLVAAVPDGRALLVLSGACWFAGFACFAWRYVPILVRAPADPARQA